VIVSYVGGYSIKTKANQNKHLDPKETIPMLFMCGNNITSSNQISDTGRSGTHQVA